METLGLAMAEVSHGGRDNVNLQCTMAELVMSARLQARLQDSGRNRHSEEVSRLV